MQGWIQAQPGAFECRWCSHDVLHPLMEHLQIPRNEWKGLMLAFYNEQGHLRAYWIWIKEGRVYIYTIGDEEFRLRPQEGARHMDMSYNHLKVDLTDRQVFEGPFRRFKCKWGFETLWKVRQAATELQQWNLILPRFRVMNRALVVFEKMKLRPSLIRRAVELSSNMQGKRTKFMAEAMKKLPFHHIRFADANSRYPGVFYNKAFKPSLIEEEFQETAVFGFPIKVKKLQH
jgi:hypothetical protein